MTSGSGVAPVVLGQSTLRRVVRGDLSASSLRIPIEPPSEAQLELEVNDAANPPLDLKGVTASFADLPWIYFETAAGTPRPVATCAMVSSPFSRPDEQTYCCH